MNESKANNLFRAATLHDVVFIARLLREFYSKAGTEYGITFDYESMLVSVDDVIRHGVCIVGPSSCAAAYLDVFPCNCNHTVANVKFWYFQQHREITIFEELLRICGAMGASEFTGSSHSPDHTIGRYYQKLGLKPVETVYIGKIKNCCKAEPVAVRDDQMP